MSVALAKLKNVMLCVMLSLYLAFTPFACKNRIEATSAEPGETQCIPTFSLLSEASSVSTSRYSLCTCMYVHVLLGNGQSVIGQQQPEYFYQVTI
jgi:hypothetical protein